MEVRNRRPVPMPGLSDHRSHRYPRPTVEPPNYTAQRTLRVLELLAFAPASAPTVGAAVGIHSRTARRLLKTLASEGYVTFSRRVGSVYLPTVRLLALAAQLAERLPLVREGHAVVADLATECGSAVALAVPSYEHVVVVASAGAGAPQRWALIPARDSALGQALLVRRAPWRESLAWSPFAHPLPRREVAAVVELRGEAVAALGLWTSDDPDQAASRLASAIERLSSRLE